MNRERRALDKRKGREEKAARLRRLGEAKANLVRANKRRAARPTSIVAPPNIQELVKKQLALFRARFGRVPAVGEPLFFDPGEATPVALKVGDHGKIVELAHVLEAPLELVKMLIASGLVIRTKPDPVPKQETA